MFSYPDAARYRVGTNYQQLPCNAAISPVYNPYQRDGPGSINGNYGADPDYVRSSLKPIRLGPRDIAHDKWVGQVAAYTSEVNHDDFVQSRDLWHLLAKQDGQQDVLVSNVAGHLKKAIPEVQSKTLGENAPHSRYIFWLRG